MFAKFSVISSRVAMTDASYQLTVFIYHCCLYENSLLWRNCMVVVVVVVVVVVDVVVICLLYKMVKHTMPSSLDV